MIDPVSLDTKRLCCESFRFVCKQTFCSFVQDVCLQMKR